MTGPIIMYGFSIKVESYWNVKYEAWQKRRLEKEIKVEPYWNYIDSYVKIAI